MESTSMPPFSLRVRAMDTPAYRRKAGSSYGPSLGDGTNITDAAAVTNSRRFTGSSSSLLGQYHLVKQRAEDFDLWRRVVSDADMTRAFYVIAVLLMTLDHPRI